jgi:hypothetical protein
LDCHHREGDLAKPWSQAHEVAEISRIENVDVRSEIACPPVEMIKLSPSNHTAILHWFW